MRVLFVLNSFGAGGTERSTAVLMSRLRERGVLVEAVTLFRAQVGDEDVVRKQGFDVHVLSGRTFFGRLRELRRIVTTRQPDIVHTAIFDADLIGRLATLGTRSRLVSSLVNTPYERARLDDPRIRPWRLRTLQVVDAVTARGVDRMHAVTEGVAAANARALRIEPQSITVVERGRDWSGFGEASPARRERVRAALGVAPFEFLVLAVGRHEFQKGHLHLVAAIARLRALGVPARLVIAGREGNASAVLRAGIDEHRMRHFVTLLGQRDDVADLLSAADVFALPSEYEGTAGAALEAMYMQSPVVATRLVGLEGILIDEVNSLLVERGDADAFAQALNAVYTDPAAARRRAGEARRLIDARFTLDRSADAMIELYRSLTPRSPHVMRQRPQSVGISVVIPVRNGAATIARAIQSVLSQPVAGLEVVVVDDGSTDGSAEVARSFGDRRITVVQQQPRGVSAARNAGVARARFDYIAFLDCDDALREGWLGWVAGAFTAGADLVFGAACFHSSDGGRKTFLPARHSHAFGAFRSQYLAGAFALRRSLFVGVGGFAEGLSYSENTDLGLRIGARSLAETLVTWVSDDVAVDAFRRPPSQDAARRRDSARFLIERRRSELARDSKLYATYLGIAGVSERRLGNYDEALRLHGNELLVRPSPRALVRTALTLVNRQINRNPLRSQVSHAKAHAASQAPDRLAQPADPYDPSSAVQA